MSLNELLGDSVIRDALKRIIEYEERKEKEFKENPIYAGLNTRPYWGLIDIPVEWHIVKKLIYAGVVERFGRRWYILRDREAVKKALQEFEAATKTPSPTQTTETMKPLVLPQDFLDIVEGYDDLKAFLKLVLTAENPVHILLVGPPGTAKSLILMEIERLGGKFITAGTATKVGIRDIIFDELPRILIIDEIDKIADSKDLSALLTWMETGRIIITKHGVRDERRGKGWVFAAANSIKGLPPELIDRFQVFHLRPYARDEFIAVTTNYLTKREGIQEDLARYIAEKVSEYSASVREARRIAHLAKSRQEVDNIIKTIKKYTAKK